MKKLGNSRRGNSTIEVAFLITPLLFFVFSTMELARLLWSYSTLAAAAKSGARYLVVHGKRCTEANSDCGTTIGGASQLIAQNGLGLDSSKIRLTFTSGDQVYSCDSAATCASDGTAWPPSAGNAAGMTLTINATYSFQSVLGFLWPGQTASSFSLTAKSSEVIQF